MHLGILFTGKTGLGPNVFGDPPTPQHMSPLSMAPLFASLVLGNPDSKTSRCALPASKQLVPSDPALLFRLSLLSQFTAHLGSERTRPSHGHP